MTWPAIELPWAVQLSPGHEDETIDDALVVEDLVWCKVPAVLFDVIVEGEEMGTHVLETAVLVPARLQQK